MRALASYAEVRETARVLVSAEVVQPSAHATTLRGIDGNLHIQDGPLADTKQQLAGTFVSDVPDLDAAIEWARLAPSLAGVRSRSGSGPPTPSPVSGSPAHDPDRGAGGGRAGRPRLLAGLHPGRSQRYAARPIVTFDGAAQALGGKMIYALPP